QRHLPSYQSVVSLLTPRWTRRVTTSWSCLGSTATLWRCPHRHDFFLALPRNLGRPRHAPRSRGVCPTGGGLDQLCHRRVRRRSTAWARNPRIPVLVRQVAQGHVDTLRRACERHRRLAARLGPRHAYPPRS